jgi:methionyl-tRNA formyltransferase
VKIVFFGTADFAVPALEAVRDHVVLVVSQPDRPSGRGLGFKPSPVKQKALELSLPVETPVKSRDPEFVERIRSLEADVLWVAAYGQILSRALLESAKQGGINLHGSILPKYRGAAPIQRCIENGDTETGVTLMQMDVGMDTGDIIAVERTPIGADETAGELFVRLAEIAGQMARDWMERIASGDYPRLPQDHESATHAAKVEKAEAQLKFEMPASHEYDRFRAFTPSPGAFIVTKLGHVRISKARLALDTDPGAGIVEKTKDRFTVGFSGGSLALFEVQPEGKKRMGGLDFANGARLKTSDCLLP